MHRFECGPEVETGNEDIDSQHQTLYAMLNEVLFSRELEESPYQFKRAVTFLFSYVEYHFASEELAMLERGYGSRRFHSAFHDHVRREARAIAATFARKISVEETRSAIFFMFEDWVMYHVQNADRQLATWMREQTPDGQAPRLPGLLPLKQAGSLAPDFDEHILSSAAGRRKPRNVSPSETVAK
jgi:hemerythrin-like metal-binding protein